MSSPALQEPQRRPDEIPLLAVDELDRVCREAGADDVGFVDLNRPALESERPHVLRALPSTRTLISFVVRMNRTPLRSPERSVANLEFHHTSDEVNDVGHRIVRALEERGIEALHPAMGFPMEMDRFPGRLWIVSHKIVAEEAGLGRMGIHRNLIHPRFGNFILLGTVLVAARVDRHQEPIDFNPCFSCKLCVSACPVGAIGADGHFSFSACLTHNYREFLGGFADWTETVADSKNARDYRRRVSDPETVSVWQSLSFGANYKAAYCMAVCPAGEDVIPWFREDRSGFRNQVVRPLQEKEEPVYATPGSDAADFVKRRFPHKELRLVGNGLRPTSIEGFLRGLPLVFQREKSRGMSTTYHFRFTGDETREATVVVQDRTLDVRDGLVGTADLRVTADTRTWLAFLRSDKSLVWALLRAKIRLRGSPRHLLAFGRCFPV